MPTVSRTSRSRWQTCSPTLQPRPTGPVGAEMDWAGWALFGVVATTALTAMMIAAQMAGLTRLDLPLVLGTVVTADPDRARIAGFFIHLAVGMGFALGYAAMFDLVHGATWWFGALLGLLHVAVALMVLLPLLPGVHPRMASHRAGPASTAVLAAPARPARPCWSRLACSPSTTAPRPLRWRSWLTWSTGSFSVCSSRLADVNRPQILPDDSPAHGPAPHTAGILRQRRGGRGDRCSRGRTPSF